MRYTVIDTESQGFSCVGGDGECYRITKTQPMFICPVNGRQEPTQSSCDANCYQQHQCNTAFGGYECPVTKARYPDQNSCTSACKSPASCNPVYTCPLNNNIYSDYQSCKAGCNNCMERGQCTSRRVCPSGYTYNSATGKCETNPICPSGGYWNPSIRQCVAYPTGHQCVIRSARCEYYYYYLNWLAEGREYYEYSTTIPMTCSSNSCNGTASWYQWWGGYPWCSYDDCYWRSGNADITARCYVDVSSRYGYNLFYYLQSEYWTDVGWHGWSLSFSKADSRSFSQCTGRREVFYLQNYLAAEVITITADMYWQPVCPSGFTLSGSMCYSTFFSCPAGSWYDWTVGKCVRDPDVYWDCSYGGTYADQQTCMANCARAIPNCCAMQGQCTGDGRIYPIETCASQCFRNEPCYVVYNHVCPVDGRVYSSPSACLSACRTPVQCILQNVNVDRYVCNLNLREYGDYNTCQQNCISQNCSSYQQGSSGGGIRQQELFVGTAGYDPECATGEKYCIIKKTVNGRVQFDTVQCNMSGTSWVCPADGGQVVEDCKCGKDLKMGLGYTAGMLEIIYSALKDRSCR